MADTPSRADVEAQVLAEFPWLDPDDLTHLIDDCTAQEREFIIDTYVTANISTISAWERIVTILGACVSIATAVSGISGAVAAVKAIV
jgi:hypothetical protein